MEEHSLEEKVDLENLLLIPSDLYSNERAKEYSYEIKEEPCGDNIGIDNLDRTEIKEETIESDEQKSDSIEFSTNKKEICQIFGLKFESKAVLKIHNSLIHPDDYKGDEAGTTIFRWT